MNIDFFRDKNYLEYQKIMSKNINIINYQNGWIFHDKFKIKPPVLKSISIEISSLRKERIKEYLKYHTVYNNILNSKNPHIYKNDYDNLVNNINEIENNINKFKNFKKQINLFDTTSLNNLERKKTIITKNINDISKKYKTQLSAIPSIEKENDVKFILKSKNDLRSIENNISEIKSKPEIDFYIIKLPKIYINNKNISDNNSSNEKKQKYKNITDEKAEKIKNNIKNLINEKFKFKNLDECISSKRSTPYWMSKEQIIIEIDKSHQIKQLMPNNYKTMKKDKICQIIEDIKK